MTDHETVHLTDESMRPVPGARPTAATIHVQTYANAGDYATHVGAMSAAGWTPISQIESTGRGGGAAAFIAALFIVGGLLFFWPVAIFGVLVGILAAVNRPKNLVVTYRPTALLHPPA